ncbi:hypothetical protein TNIN_411531 [Trichonephila inaurata madagascariensis]|uniref:Uncharacterized protein n=1 Tax=Trichonephila inaurata madagascariensis TaxID=2747483 RepID=A0A8X7C6A5_9ARAC|nr:hypothetical protein TNIN_411531 [Trichonephila inaurata madagascariensis]
MSITDSCFLQKRRDHNPKLVLGGGRESIDLQFLDSTINSRAELQAREGVIDFTQCLAHLIQVGEGENLSEPILPR